jgi:Sec7-like guanine-nucleotide exchange factor
MEFIKAMCDITKREFQNNSLTRIFFLQKIVEVVEIYLFSLHKFNNIDDIWKIISNFFIEIGISSNIENATTSIDSLRQLTMKYLEKKEEKKYNFQNQCFKPFLSITKKCNNNVIKEYIIYCLINIIKNNESNIKSGWSIILSIFSEFFQTQEDNSLQIQILEILEHLSLSNYEEISNILEKYIQCILLYVDKFPEKVNKILESLILKIENEKNLKILINSFMQLLLNNNIYTRNKSLENFSNCFDTRIKLNDSNLFEIGKNPNFWNYIINI